MTLEEQKKADELKKADEAKAEEAKKADELKKAEEAKKAEKVVTEEDLLKAIANLEEFAKAKKEIEEEEEEEDDDLEESLVHNLEENDTLEKAIDVSPFLEALVSETKLSLGAMGKEIGKLTKSMGEFDGKEIDALKQIAEVVKGLTSKIEDFAKSTDERLKAIEQTPVGRKSILKAASIEKSFTGGADDFATIPKRVIVDALEKAVLDQKIPDGVLISYESEQNYPLTESQIDIVKAYMNK